MSSKTEAVRSVTSNPKSSFEVFVDDNYHFMQEDERYSAGTFDTYEEAVAKAQTIVDRCLASYYTEGMTAEKLFRCYRGYGEDPFIVGDLGQDVINETMARANAIIEQMESRVEAQGNSFEELNKPLNLPECKVRFSAWDYAEKRCGEMCQVKEEESSQSPENLVTVENLTFAICKLADRGALKLFNKSLDELKTESDESMGMERICELAFAGCEDEGEFELLSIFKAHVLP